MYQEYVSDEGYDNTFAKLTSASGMADIDISVEACAPLWAADRVEEEVKSLRREIEPRVKLALTVTGRSDPTFFEMCVGQNAVLWAVLYTVLRSDCVGGTVFRPVFCRDMGAIGYDALDEHGGRIYSAEQLETPQSTALTLTGAKRSAFATGIAMQTPVPIWTALGAEELAGAKEARLAAGALHVRRARKRPRS